MMFTAAASGALLLGAAMAAPAALMERQSTNIDTTILQFALTLEHLENVFYKGALKNFTAADFAAAGYGADYYNNLKYIAHDEEVHVTTLSAALTAAGVTPNAACTYSFPYTDVLSFITLSSVLEGVGTSAYLAGAPLITSKYYLTVAGSILVTEALHTSMQRGAINEVPMANPFGTPLDPTSVYTLAAMFITSCPSSNMALPFTPFPSLMLDASVCTCEEPNCSPPKLQKRNAEPNKLVKDDSEWTDYSSSDGYSSASSSSASYSHGYSSSTSSSATYSHSYSSATSSSTPYSHGYSSATSSSTPYSHGYSSTTSGYAKPTATGLSDTCSPPMPGSTIKLTAAKNIPAGSYVTFVNGLSVESVKGTIDGSNIMAAIPADDQGQTYVFVTSSDQEGTLSDAAVLFGPAILEVYPPAPSINYGILKV